MCNFTKLFISRNNFFLIPIRRLIISINTNSACHGLHTFKACGHTGRTFLHNIKVKSIMTCRTSSIFSIRWTITFIMAIRSKILYFCLYSSGSWSFRHRFSTCNSSHSWNKVSFNWIWSWNSCSISRLHKTTIRN